MNQIAPTRPWLTPPGARLSVTLMAAQWRVIERQLEKGKYLHVNRIMEDLRAQLALANMRNGPFQNQQGQAGQLVDWDKK